MTRVDFIIVGSGSAGATLAACLSANPTRQVLLIEAGPVYRAKETPDPIRGANFGPVIGTGLFHWTDLTARMADQQEPRIYLQGRGVGGTSALNGQGALRGLPADFDHWASLGCTGWSWRDVLPTFVAVEDDVDFGAQPYHGVGGPVPVMRTACTDGPVSAAVREVALAFGHPDNADINAPDATGVLAAAWNRRDGARVSTNDSHLEAARDRDNLQVLGDTLVTRILFEGSRAIGVEVADADGVRLIEAGEVFVCAGAIHSPALLMRSGLGPADALCRADVPVVADLPGVGANLCDHPMVWLAFPLNEQDRTPWHALPGHTFLRYSSELAGAAPDDVEIYSLDRGNMDLTEGGLMIAVMQPYSRGAVTITTADPSVEPTVELRLLSDSRDLVRLREATRYAARFTREVAMKSLLTHQPQLAQGQTVDDFDDAELDQWLGTECREYYHPTGTCRMADPKDAGTVVDPECRVVGVQNLRVIDASVMPEPLRSPTHLTTVMIAEHLARRSFSATGVTIAPMPIRRQEPA